MMTKLTQWKMAMNGIRKKQKMRMPEQMYESDLIQANNLFEQLTEDEVPEALIFKLKVC